MVQQQIGIKCAGCLLAKSKQFLINFKETFECELNILKFNTTTLKWI